MQRRTTKLIFFLLIISPVLCLGQNLVIKASKYLDVQTRKMISPAVIVIEEGIITSINPDEVPHNYEVVDLGNKILLPGLIDCHVHLNWDREHPYRI